MDSFFLTCGVRTIFFLTLPMVGACACTWAGQATKETVVNATSSYGPEHFILSAELPANLEFTSKAQYSPKRGESCQLYSPGLGGTVTRQQQKTDRAPAKRNEQTVNFDIPLEFHIYDCTMELTRVDTYVGGHYGPTPMDIGEDGGGISIRDSLTSEKQNNPSVNDPVFRGLCTWMFQLSRARIEKDGISKILSCSAADANWSTSDDIYSHRKPGGVIQRNELAGKKIVMRYKLASEEQPGSTETWGKVSSGWKPCIETEKTIRCQTPPAFRTFKMNGRECTVYPGCTE